MVADAEDVPPITASPIPNCHWLLQFLTAEIYPSSLIQTFLSGGDLNRRHLHCGKQLHAAVPVAFCRVQITVTPAINIEVWLPPAGNWNHRFQAEGGGGYAGAISYSGLAMAVTGDAVTGQFATASTDTGHPAAGTANGQGGANGAQGGGGFALNPTNDTLNEGLIVDFASRSLHEMTEKAKAVIKAYYGKPQDYAYWN